MLKVCGSPLCPDCRECRLNVIKGFDRVELNMWEFNSSALEFYEAMGFRTYRRYMELKL